MSRPSTIDELPEALRSEIGRLRTQGASIDRIVEHLRTLVGARAGVAADVAAPSRSAVGRHVQKLEVAGERLRRTRAMAEGLKMAMGDASTGDIASINIALLHQELFDLLNRAEDIDGGTDGGHPDKPKPIVALADMIEKLTRASKNNVDFIRVAEAKAAERAKREAVAAVESVGKAEGITRATMDAIKAGIFGVRAPA